MRFMPAKTSFIRTNAGCVLYTIYYLAPLIDPVYSYIHAYINELQFSKLGSTINQLKARYAKNSAIGRGLEANKYSRPAFS